MDRHPCLMTCTDSNFSGIRSGSEESIRQIHLFSTCIHVLRTQSELAILDRSVMAWLFLFTIHTGLSWRTETRAAPSPDKYVSNSTHRERRMVFSPRRILPKSRASWIPYARREAYRTGNERREWTNNRVPICQ